MYVGFRTWRVTIDKLGRKSWKGIEWIPFKWNHPIFLVSVPQGKMHTYPSNCNALRGNAWQNQSGGKQKHVVHKEKHQCLSDPRLIGFGSTKVDMLNIQLLRKVLKGQRWLDLGWDTKPDIWLQAYNDVICRCSALSLVSCYCEGNNRTAHHYAVFKFSLTIYETTFNVIWFPLKKVLFYIWSGLKNHPASLKKNPT